MAGSFKKARKTHLRMVQSIQIFGDYLKQSESTTLPLASQKKMLDDYTTFMTMPSLLACQL